jgi:hypothetical protein
VTAHESRISTPSSYLNLADSLLFKQILVVTLNFSIMRNFLAGLGLLASAASVARRATWQRDVGKWV